MMTARLCIRKDASMWRGCVAWQPPGGGSGNQMLACSELRRVAWQPVGGSGGSGRDGAPPC